MMPPTISTAGLVTGERLTVEEFLRRWEEIPELKNAELIEGVVYVPSPVSFEHGHLDAMVHLWLGYYAQATPGCQTGSNSTWLMLENAPQPDAYLRISPSHGGQSGNAGNMGAGAPELVVEISFSSTEIDFGPKLRLYQNAGVREYITIERFGPRIVWRVLEDGTYTAQSVPTEGIVRSQVFPGLWLDLAAFWADDGAKMLAALNAGLASEEHGTFVEHLRANLKLS